jgi:phosphate transport system permease protein
MTERTYDQALLKRRYGSERRFRTYGIAALTLTVAFLAYLVIDIAIKAVPAFRENQAVLEVSIDAAKAKDGDFAGILKDAMRGAFPGVTARADKKKLSGLVSTGAADDLRKLVQDRPDVIGTTIKIPILLSDNADLYLKGQVTKVSRAKGAATLQLAKSGEDYLITGDTKKLAPGQIISANGGALRVKSNDASGVIAEPLTPPETLNTLVAGTYDVISFGSRESERNIDDKSILWLEALKDKRQISSGTAWRFFYDSDSREAEVAGLRGAITGSLLTVAVTLLLSVPLGLAAAIYLEQFAPHQ